MKKLLFPALALAAVIGGGVWYSGQSGSPAIELPNVVPPAVAQESADAADIEIADFQMGNPEASVEVIEYASFTCPHCATFHDSVLPKLKADYIDTDKINFVYREVFFDRYGLWAAMVARCGGEEKYFGISDLLYDKQREWAQGEPAEIANNLRRIGKTAGLSDEALDACFGNAAQAEAMVAYSQENMEADKVTGTPSFVIDGKTYSNMSYEDLSEILDEKLEKADG
ncbi:DsbA family protein [Palleronia caenipelagi]|uniref:DsbA family protein n=1 Tax=Palleronia caenipelagi TaxID=2489174 RepID=A0A547Q882_9RHOB|nr:DsbA family protein [Palleronia caenipelagi]TRD22597.1 DsbA family protein [Palleronia caenipelagi]